MLMPVGIRRADEAGERVWQKGKWERNEVSGESTTRFERRDKERAKLTWILSPAMISFQLRRRNLG